MKRLLSTICLVGLLLLFISQKNSSQAANDYSSDYSRAETLYKKAGQLSKRADTDEKIQQLQNEIFNEALAWYKTAITKASRAGNDSVSFHSCIKIGLISLYLDNLRSAKESYLKAIALKPRLPRISDSILFKPYLFLGGIFYQQNQFDSASMYYQKAEQILNSYGTILDESQRLYNRQGALFYESGNYRLAKTYFEKALIVLSPTDPSYVPLMVNYKMNIASISVKLELYDEAKRIYESLLHYNVYENEIWHNIGIIDNHLRQFDEAIRDLRNVKYTGAKNIDLDYNLALAFDSLNKSDSVQFYIGKAARENSKFNGNSKSTAWGLVLKFMGDKNQRERNYEDALKSYQAAIMQFDISFNDADISKNPSRFTGIFSFINLFQTLAAKAETHQKLYSEKKEIKNLEASLGAYRSAFGLADYVGKTYESDESRLFLNHIKYTAHSRPIDVCLTLYDITRDSKYLEEAYLFDQRNKASILTFNIQLAEQAGISSEIVKNVGELRTAVTRLSLKAAQSPDSNQVAQLNEKISGYEIQLGKLQLQLNNDPKYAQLQPLEWIPSIRVLQNKILDANGAVLSYHLSTNELVVFVITQKSFNYYTHSIQKNFFNELNSYARYLRQVNAGEKYRGDSSAKRLYEILITPIFSLIRSCKRLIIIPDDELNYIPFEALKSDAEKYLLESFSVQYQYSTALLNIHPKTKRISSTQILAFAPFANRGEQNKFEPLQYSKAEVENLNGKILVGSNASKQNFISSANHYKIIHLATHASANDESPLYSSIVFFPAGPDSSYRLYAQEIYNLKLDSTDLIILSACETGTGQLIKGEGLMSLSRAIAYAGCPNIVTSLWRAEDKSTAYITKRLHFYLNKNYSKDEALQKAKLDLLQSKGIQPQFKTPNSWAHLVFIGNYQPEGKNNLFLRIVLSLLVISVAMLLYVKRKTWLNQPGEVLQKD